MTSVVAGIGWHVLGAGMAASFYAPIEKVKQWSWETTWAVAGLFSWILLPIGVSLILLPDFSGFYASMGWPLLLKVAMFGAMWGVGNVSYGLTMRHLGMSLGIGIAIGVTLIVGTLVPPVLHGQAGMLFTTRSGLLTMAGVFVALIGVAVVSYAGHQKEVQLRGPSKGDAQEFNLTLGLFLAVMCGIFSSGMSFAIDAAKPMEAAAIHLGVNPLYAALPSYVFIMGGGAIVNLSYCFIRLAALPRLSLRADLRQGQATVTKNTALAATGGIMWYLQFFFYAWGAANIPAQMSYVNWMLHMSIYVLCGGLVGLALGEWSSVKGRPVRLLWVGIAVIIAAANLVGLGMAS
ncbi:MAG TPA: L-rhamnose/proton symporter RhaT [Terracidiphilus sp.]|jgi:L-rhamnose-H+ transport protein|nr:L-rhamnose/proton symporter RhaT [Terracidiphilus sp.]